MYSTELHQIGLDSGFRRNDGFVFPPLNPPVNGGNFSTSPFTGRIGVGFFA